ncbi:CLUMA_CG010680, isoform A [Clunio marinus]|uniref:CLUMA_CG010680, isoform A n=1 Tax=Clunio marinus TaxID=568069 RepID=A0A1J1IAH4_9DIPT|nr:CLUMA_CG010680, isoform A [Clunio marinus]
MGEKILQFGFEIPIIEWDSTLGYPLNFFYGAYLISVFYFALTSTLGYCTVCVLMALGQFSALKVMFEDLEEMIVNNDDGSKHGAIKQQIKLIAEMHNELLE